jgi:hypothetical protein
LPGSDVYAGLTLRYVPTEDLETDFNVPYDRVEDGAWTYGITGLWNYGPMGLRAYGITGLYAIHERVALKAEANIDNDADADVSLLAGVRLAL